jgi:hypothetical protein
VTAIYASVIDIDAFDAFAPCDADDRHGPAHARVIVGPGDVRHVCYGCAVALTGRSSPDRAPTVGYLNGCYLCDLDACRAHGGDLS